MTTPGGVPENPRVMDPDVIDLTVGISLIAASLALLVSLVLWSRRTIERIARSKSRSAREIARLRGER